MRTHTFYKVMQGFQDDIKCVAIFKNRKSAEALKKKLFTGNGPLDMSVWIDVESLQQTKTYKEDVNSSLLL